MRIYLNDRDGGRGTGPGYIEVLPDKTIVNATSLEDSHPVFQVAAGESLGFKAVEKVRLGPNPTRKEYGEYLSQALNDAPDIGGLKTQVWSPANGRMVRIYVNSPGSKNGPSGRPEYLDVTVNGIVDKTSLPSDHPLLLTARQIESDALAQSRLRKAGRRYTVAGVPYALRVAAGTVNLVRIPDALFG